MNNTRERLEQRVKLDLVGAIASQDVEEIRSAHYVSVIILGGKRAKQVLFEMFAQAQQRMSSEEYKKLNAELLPAEFGIRERA